MNPDNHTPWTRLAAAARRAPETAVELDAMAPTGFATRVVACAGLRPHHAGFGVGLERLAARMLGLAAVCAVATVLWVGMSGVGEVRAESVAEIDLLDPVAVILEAAQS